MNLHNEINFLVDSFFDEMKTTRCFLHSHPEESFKEFQTSAFIKDKLTDIGIRFESVGETGVLGVIQGGITSSRRIAFRADIDALWVEGQLHHACGHDAHATILLTLAKILFSHREDLAGTIYLIFQQGEEKVPGGATQFLSDAQLPPLDAIFALHVFPDLPTGYIGMPHGVCMASCDELNITFRGRGGHAAKVALRQNTIIPAASFIDELASLYPERPEGPIVVIAAVDAPGTYNAIPSEVVLRGTMRTFDESQRLEIKKTIRSLAAKIAARHNLSVDVNISDGYPSLINNLSLEKKIYEIFTENIGNDSLVEIPPMFTSEDFAWFSQKFPAYFFRLGCRNDNKGINAPQHSSQFDIDEECLKVGLRSMLLIATSFK